VPAAVQCGLAVPVRLELTNLIVLGQLPLSGADFLARMRMRAPALAALVITAAVVERAASRGLHGGPVESAPARFHGCRNACQAEAAWAEVTLGGQANSRTLPGYRRFLPMLQS